MQKLDRETSHFRDRFFIDFSRIFDPILHEKTAKTMEGCSFFMFSLLRLQDRFWTVLGSFWHRFCFNFGSQNFLKTHPKTDQKNHRILNRFFFAFWSIWAPLLGPSWVPKSVISVHKGVKKRPKRRFKSSSQKSFQNEPKMTPKWVQKPPPGHRFSLILGRFFLTNLVRISFFFLGLVLGIRQVVAWYLLGSCLIIAL